MIGKSSYPHIAVGIPSFFRFDLMSGMNGEEGNFMLVFDFPMVVGKNITDEDISVDDIRNYLEHKCGSMLTKYSPELCAQYVITTYNIDEAGIDTNERIRRTRDFTSE